VWLNGALENQWWLANSSAIKTSGLDGTAEGVARKTMTKIAGLLGAEAVLKAMKSNEEAPNKAYKHHAEMDFPPDVLEVIERNYQDEKRHLQWVIEALRTRPWEQAPAHP
jgi:hypothetical protein